MDAVVEKEKAIRMLVETAVRSYATGFEARHVAQKDDPDGVINMKVHNPFIAALGPEVQYYSALVRSLDSSLGDMLEGLAISIAQLSYQVSREVQGYLSDKQTGKIARLGALEDLAGIDECGRTHIRRKEKSWESDAFAIKTCASKSKIWQKGQLYRFAHILRYLHSVRLYMRQ